MPGHAHHETRDNFIPGSDDKKHKQEPRHRGCNAAGVAVSVLVGSAHGTRSSDVCFLGVFELVS